MNFTQNKIALGSVQFGLDYGISNKSGKTTFEEIFKILDLALTNNIVTIDTAHAYGDSEKKLGGFDMYRFQIISKFINVKNSDNLIKQFNESLKFLNLKSIYGYLSHRPLDVVNYPELWETLKKLKNENKIQKIGFSFNDLIEFDRVMCKGFIPDIIQVPYNYFDNRFENVMIQLKSKYKTEIHTRSTFLQGLFFMNPYKLDSFFDSIKPILIKNRSNNLHCQLLQFVLEKKFIDKVIIGVNNSFQFNENIINCSKKVDQLPVLNYKIPDEILNPSQWKI